MPSLFIFQYNIERFKPRRAAAPLGPPKAIARHGEIPGQSLIRIQQVIYRTSGCS